MRRVSRYHQPPLLQSTYDLKNTQDLKSKQLTSSNSILNPSANKNPEIQFLRLPALNSMRRSASSFTERNTKFKLQTIEEKVQELAADVYNTRLQAQETKNRIAFLNQTLVINELGSVRQDLKKQAKGLERFMKGIIVANEDRTRMIKDDCAELWRSTQAIHQALFDLRMRTEKLQEGMGFNNKLRQ